MFVQTRTSCPKKAEEPALRECVTQQDMQIVDFEEASMLLKRLSLSIAGGITVPLLLVIVAMIIHTIFPEQREMAWLGAVYFWVAGWPLKLFNVIFPQSPNCPDCGPVGIAVMATMIWDVVMYSLLIYIVLWWRSKRVRFR
jgi:hypothetical protein